MKNNSYGRSISRVNSGELKLNKKTFADCYFQKLNQSKGKIEKERLKSNLISPEIKKTSMRTQTSKNSRDTSKSGSKKLVENRDNRVQQKIKTLFSNRFSKIENAKTHQRILTNTESDSKSITQPSEKYLPDFKVHQAEPFKNSRNQSRASEHSSTTDLPESVRTQPLQSLFLCTNCFQYFLYPQKLAHVNHCFFQSTYQESIYKLNRLRQMLIVVSKKYPNPYSIAISKKIDKYLNNEISLEDILILEWFIINSKVEIGLNWKELFWVIQKVGKLKDSYDQTKKNMIWVLCK